MKREELKLEILDTIRASDLFQPMETTTKIMSLIDEYTEEQYKELENPAYTKPKGKSLEERSDEFINSVQHNADGLYPHGMVLEFIAYWTEHGENDKKMRFEKEKSFGIKRRLATWAKNDKNWNKDNESKADKANDWLKG